MFANFPVNDDWLFVRQVQEFLNSNFRINSEIDPSFLLQGILGFLWGKIFGADFSSLKILTLIITLLGIFGFGLILKQLKIKKEIIILSLLLLFFNPLIFTSAFSFMTDNYFLTFFIFTVYFFIKYFDKYNYKYLLLGCVFLIFSSLVRQVGVLTGVAVIFTLLIKQRKFDKKLILNILTIIFSIILSYVIIRIWPRFGVNRIFIYLENLVSRTRLMLMALPYFLIFLFPLFYGFKSTIKKSIWLFIVIFISFLFYFYYFDFFPVGNVLYLESLYSKSDFRSNLSIFDNVIFKLFLSIFLSFSIAKFTVFVKENYRKIKSDITNVFLILLFLLNYFVLVLSSDFYDRYLLVSFVCIFIFFIKNFSTDILINKKLIFSILLFIFITVCLQWEFGIQNKLKWEQAKFIGEKTGFVKQIDLNDTYQNYIISSQIEDFSGNIKVRSFDRKCYIQQYTQDSQIKIFSLIKSIDDFLQDNILENKKPYFYNKREGIPRIKNNLEKLMFNQQYFSLIYNLVGKKSYIGSWCMQ